MIAIVIGGVVCPIDRSITIIDSKDPNALPSKNFQLVEILTPPTAVKVVGDSKHTAAGSSSVMGSDRCQHCEKVCTKERHR